MGHSTQIGFVYGSAFSISYRVFDMGIGMLRELSEKELPAEKKAILDQEVQEVIQKGKLADIVLKSEGSEYWIKGRGIYRVEGDKRFDLVDDPRLKADRKTTRSKLESLSGKVAKAAKTKGTIMIDIKVAPSLVRDFDRALAKEFGFFEQLNSIVDNWNPKKLKKQRYSDSQIKELKQKYEKLRDQVQQRLDLMDKTRELMGGEGYDVGVNYFASKVQATHADYLAALAAVQTDQKILEGQLDPKNKDLLDLTHPKTHEEALQSLRTNAEALKIPPAVLVEASTAVTSANKTYFESLELPDFFKVVDEHFSAEQTLCEQLTSFSAKFQKNEAGIRDVLRKEGHSDLEISYMFSHIENNAKVSRNMQDGLRVVRKLILEEKYDEALKSYSDLMIEQYPQYSQMMSRGVLALKEVAEFIQIGFDAKMIKSIQERFNIDFKNLESQMAPFMQRPPKVELLSRRASERFSVLKNIPETELPKHWNDACEVIAKANRATNEMVRNYERLTGGKTPFAALEDVAAWQKALRDQGLTKNDVAEIQRFYADQAKEFGSIYRGYLVVDDESDPRKERMARAQLRKLCQERSPNLRKLNQRFQKLGGMVKLDRLEEAIKEYQNKQPGKEKAQLEYLAGMRGVIEDRDHFFKLIYEDVHLQRNWQSGSMDRLLQDKSLLKILEVKGFTRAELAKMGRLYDEYSKTFEPVFLAKEALDDDPDNVQLQQDLRRVYTSQMPKLKKIATQMKASRMQDLDKELAGQSKLVDKILKTGEGSFYEDQKQVFLQRQRMLRTTPGYLKEVRKMEEMISAVEKNAHIGMSGDRGFVRKMITGPIFKKEKAWKELLTENKVMERDLKRLNQRHDELTELLTPLQALDRALEADPGNHELRDELKKLAEESRLSVVKCSERLGAEKELAKCSAFSNAAKAFRKILKTRRVRLQTAIDISTTQKGQMMLKAEPFSRAELDRALYQLGEASKGYAYFRERSHFLRDLYDRLDSGQI